MGRITDLKKAAVAYGRWQLLRGYDKKPPFGVNVATEVKGTAINALLRLIYATPPKTPADWADWYVNLQRTKAPMHYDELRPMTFPAPPAYPTKFDCSWFATLCQHDAGWPDPNGQGYSGVGNTATLAVHGTKVATPHRDDLAFYGSGETIEHVAVVCNASTVASMGEEGDPRHWPIATCGDAAFHVIEYRRYTP